jgi:hypothetical protein
MAIYFAQVTALMLLFTFVSICRWTMNFSLNFLHGENNNANIEIPRLPKRKKKIQNKNCIIKQHIKNVDDSIGFYSVKRLLSN